MRPYRGKTKEGELVKGWYCKWGRRHYIFDPKHCMQFLGCFIQVIPETVGQFTGRKDKNGKEIYEGDIVKNERGEIGEIIFANGAFVSKYLPPDNWDAMEPYDGLLDRQEVIGNIHQPELIEDKDNG